MKADRCRACGSGALRTVHDFGLQPLAGNFPTAPASRAEVKKYPLDLSQCRQCGLLQVLNLPPINEVFHEDYRYSSSTVPGLVRHFDEYCDWLAGRLAPGARVLEFGCNDGVLLERLRARGFACVGVDASDNVAQLARGKGLDVRTGFLTPQFVASSPGLGGFDLVTCSNVFAHIHDVTATISAVRAVLAPRGLFSVEVHDGALVSEQGQFDTVYHEHLTYFTEQTLRSLLEHSGFEFVCCERTSMHGGGLRLVARLAGPASPGAPWGGSSLPETDGVSGAIARCREELLRLHEKHGSLAGYGAAGRSQMFINFTGSTRLFDRVYDDSPLRQGRFIAGSDIPILPYAGEGGPCIVVLAWNYAGDIATKLRGRFGEIMTLIPSTRRW